MFGAWTEAALLLLVVDGVDQFPKSDLTAGAAAAVAGWVVVMAAVDGVPLRVFVRLANGDGATVLLLLVDPPNTEAALLAGTVVTGLLLVMDDGGTKVAAAGASPKMGLKVGAAGVLSEAEVVEEAEVVLTEKMGLKPEESRGLELLLLEAAVATGVEDEDAAAVVIPNRLPPVAAGPPPPLPPAALTA